MSMPFEDVFARYPVEGNDLTRWVVPPKGHCALVARRGQRLRFVDLEGQQVVDLVAFALHDLTDCLNMGNGQMLNGRLTVARSDVLYSVDCTPLMRVQDYSHGDSHAYGSMCSEPANRLRFGESGSRNCRDNLADALRDWGIGRRQIPNAFVPFMNVGLASDGTLTARAPTTQPGDYYELEALCDVLVGISNCPQEYNAVNGYRATAMGVVTYEP